MCFAQVTEESIGNNLSLYITALKKVVEYLIDQFNVVLQYPKLDSTCLLLPGDSSASFASNHEFFFSAGLFYHFDVQANLLSTFLYFKYSKVPRAFLSLEGKYGIFNAFYLFRTVNYYLQSTKNLKIPGSIMTGNFSFFNILRNTSMITKDRLMGVLKMAKSLYDYMKVQDKAFNQMTAFLTVLPKCKKLCFEGDIVDLQLRSSNPTMYFERRVRNLLSKIGEC